MHKVAENVMARPRVVWSAVRARISGGVQGCEGVDPDHTHDAEFDLLVVLRQRIANL